MELTIRPATAQNRAALAALAASPAQAGFIEPVRDCLAEADALALWRPVGIYDGETAIGFAMYGLFADEGAHGRVWLDRFLIDHCHQGRGYGAAALRLLLGRLQAEYGVRDIFLSLYDENLAARALYEKHGFVQTDERDQNGEHVMVRRALSR